ncbi:MAG: DUF692 family multinuclear iron-containing protein [Anaerolineaceae bacterium]|jgi:Uncharacterized protein conserved in bacteria
MKLTVNHSLALLDLIQTNQVHIDAIEWVDNLGVSLIRQTRSLFPNLPFHFHPGRMHFSKNGYTHLEEYLSVCPESPHISIHLAPLPMLWTYPALRSHIYLPGPNPQSVIRRFINQVLALKNRSFLPVILENMPPLHPARYCFENEPAVIHQILEESNCNLLLDLAHVRIAAEVRNIPVEEYLSALPLEKAVQIHVAGVRRNEKGRLYDAHQPLQEEDYRLLEWTLARSNPAWLTLEYFQEDKPALLSQLNQLSHYV